MIVGRVGNCACGHSVFIHTLYPEDGDPSNISYQIMKCSMDGCSCQFFKTDEQTHQLIYKESI